MLLLPEDATPFLSQFFKVCTYSHSFLKRIDSLSIFRYQHLLVSIQPAKRRLHPYTFAPPFINCLQICPSLLWYEILEYNWHKYNHKFWKPIFQLWILEYFKIDENKLNFDISFFDKIDNVLTIFFGNTLIIICQNLMSNSKFSSFSNYF